jgi:hypothetical protein
MFKKIAEFFTGKKPEAAPEAPYKVDPIPTSTEAAIIVGAGTETMVVVVPDAVVPAAIIEQAPAPAPSPTKKPRAPAKPKAVVAKAPAATKKPRAPKAK